MSPGHPFDRFCHQGRQWQRLNHLQEGSPCIFPLLVHTDLLQEQSPVLSMDYLNLQVKFFVITHTIEKFLTLVAVILGTGNRLQIHSPELFWKNILGLRVLTIGFTESCLVCMREVASYWCRWDRSIVLWVSWVCQAVITADGTALGPPKARLSCPTLLTSRSQVTGPIVCTGTACS